MATAAVLPALVLATFSQLSPWAVQSVLLLGRVPRALRLASGFLSACLLLLLWYLKQKQNERKASLWWAVLITTVSFVVTFGLAFHWFPVAAVALLTLLSTLLLYGAYLVMKKPEKNKADKRGWYKACRISFLILGVACCVTWVVWIVWRKSTTRMVWLTDWTEGFRSLLKSGDINWKIAFVSWALPLAMGTELLLLALLCHLRFKQIEQPQAEHPEQMHLQHAEQNEKTQQAVRLSQFKFLLLVMSVAMMSLYIMATIESTGAHNDTTEYGARDDFRGDVMTLCFFISIGLISWIGGPSAITEAAKSSKLAKRVGEGMRSDWVKAACLLGWAPVLPLIWVSLGPWRAACSCVSSVFPSRKEWIDDLDTSVSEWKEWVEEWPWTQVFVKAHYLGILYVTWEVGFLKFTYLALAYSKQLLAPLPLPLVCATMYAIGTFLFLLPPTPGMPVYAITGIIVCQSATVAGVSFTNGVILACGVGTAIKFSFAAMAQKCIGEPLGTSVSVRQLCQVHQPETRAIEKILRADGFVAQASIICGGPDWPVSVLCGILRLPLGPVLVRLLPVIPQSVVPAVLFGALLVNAADKRGKALAQLALTVSGLLQMAAGIMACAYIQNTIENDFDALTQWRAQDDDVIKLEEKSADENKVYDERTSWGVLRWYMRAVLILGLLLMEVSIAILMAAETLGMHCFKEFDLTSSVEENLQGDPWSLVNAIGWLALALFTLSCALLCSFMCWASQCAARSDGSPESQPLSGGSGSSGEDPTR